MKKELIELIEKEISYDGNILYKCDRCGHAPVSNWIDHKSTLANEIAKKLGLRSYEKIYTILEEIKATGDKKKDAEEIVRLIDYKVIGIS